MAECRRAKQSVHLITQMAGIEFDEAAPQKQGSSTRISSAPRTMPQGTYGIGLEFEMSDGLPVVCGIKPGGGCSAHDIKEGDVLVRVDKTCISARMVRSAPTHPAAGSSNRNQVYTETFSGV